MINHLLLNADNSILSKLVFNSFQELSNLANIEVFNQKNESTSNYEAEIILSTGIEDACVIQQVDIEPTGVSYLCSKPKQEIFDIQESIITLGLQRHLLAKDLTLPEHSFFLNEIRNDISLTEPHLRDARLFICDLNVLRKSEVKNLDFAPPSGLFSEDLSQIFRYAGMSQSISKVVILNAREELHELLAQLIWYFAEAAANRKPDHPYFTDSVIEYAVNLDSSDLDLSFYKSKVTGRWWVKVPNVEENKWIPCNYEDYLKACSDEISPNLLQALTIPV